MNRTLSYLFSALTHCQHDTQSVATYNERLKLDSNLYSIQHYLCIQKSSDIWCTILVGFAKMEITYLLCCNI